MTVSLAGKMPSEADFVSSERHVPGRNDLFGWLIEATRALAPRRDRLPEQPVRFQFVSEHDGVAMLGVMVPSADSVGRRFPLAAFRLLKLSEVNGHSGSTFGAHETWFRSVCSVLIDSASLSWLEARDQLGAIEAPDQASLTHVQKNGASQADLCALSASEFHSRLFAAEPDNAHLYAYDTVRQACANAAENGAAASIRQAPVLDCPVHTEMDAIAWIALVDSLRPTTAPSLFWLSSPKPRLFICLGAPPAGLLGALNNSEADQEWIWPLRTQRDQSVVRAAERLAALDALSKADPDASLQTIFDTLSKTEEPNRAPTRRRFAWRRRS